MDLKETYFLYQAHVEGRDLGWQSFVGLGIISGTTGESRRLEAMRFSANILIPNFTVRAHVQWIGWLPYVEFGEIVGTTGEKRRMEAIQINVPSSYATNVFYRVYVQNIGWMSYVSNNEIAGTTGQGLRIEAFQMHMYIID
jgi:uncharacterized protein YjdB